MTGTSGSRPRTRAAAALALATILASCGRADPPEQSPPTDPPGPTSVSTPDNSTSGEPTGPAPDDDGDATSALPPVPEGFLGVDEMAEQEPQGAGDLRVTGVRTGAHPEEGFDRVVFDLDGAGQVGWWVEYQDEPALSGSGFPVSLAGGATLVVTIRGTGIPEPGDDIYDPGQLLVSGAGLQSVTEVLRTTPFEGQLLAYVGVAQEQPFRVTRLTDPDRLVIDVASSTADSQGRR